MIEIVDLWKWYPTHHGRKHVLRGVNAFIPTGVNVGLIGRNGAGKSTLLRLIGRAETPERGRIITTGTVSWPLGLDGGYQGSMTGRENTRFVCRLYGLTAEETTRVADQVMEFSELGNYFDMPVKTYSSGMRSRLTFSVSMSFEFDYYLIDEIQAVGDIGYKDKSHASMEKKKRSANFIMASHDLATLRKDVDVILLVEKGSVTLFMDPNDAITAYQEIMR